MEGKRSAAHFKVGSKNAWQNGKRMRTSPLKQFNVNIKSDIKNFGMIWQWRKKMIAGQNNRSHFQHFAI